MAGWFKDTYVFWFAFEKQFNPFGGRGSLEINSFYYLSCYPIQRLTSTKAALVGINFRLLARTVAVATTFVAKHRKFCVTLATRPENIIRLIWLDKLRKSLRASGNYDVVCTVKFTNTQLVLANNPHLCERKTIEPILQAVTRIMTQLLLLFLSTKYCPVVPLCFDCGHKFLPPEHVIEVEDRSRSKAPTMDSNSDDLCERIVNEIDVVWRKNGNINGMVKLRWRVPGIAIKVL